MRFLEEREVKLNALRRALKEGEESGFVEYSLDGLLMDLDKESAKSATTSRAGGIRQVP